jgi:hypothetical protein
LPPTSGADFGWVYANSRIGKKREYSQEKYARIQGFVGFIRNRIREGYGKIE